MAIDDKVAKAATDLEDIAVLAKTISQDLREGKHAAYARVYWLRHRLSKIVATLGVGAPPGLPLINIEYKKFLDEQ